MPVMLVRSCVRPCTDLRPFNSYGAGLGEHEPIFLDPGLKLVPLFPAQFHNALIPCHVLRNRHGADDMSPMQAIAFYLCDDPDGPELTQQAAADLLGKARGTIKTQLGEARDKLGD